MMRSILILFIAEVEVLSGYIFTPELQTITALCISFSQCHQQSYLWECLSVAKERFAHLDVLVQKYRIKNEIKPGVVKLKGLKDIYQLLVVSSDEPSVGKRSVYLHTRRKVLLWLCFEALSPNLHLSSAKTTLKTQGNVSRGANTFSRLCIYLKNSKKVVLFPVIFEEGPLWFCGRPVVLGAERSRFNSSPCLYVAVSLCRTPNF